MHSFIRHNRRISETRKSQRHSSNHSRRNSNSKHPKKFQSARRTRISHHLGRRHASKLRSSSRLSRYFNSRSPNTNVSSATPSKSKSKQSRKSKYSKHSKHSRGSNRKRERGYGSQNSQNRSSSRNKSHRKKKKQFKNYKSHKFGKNFSKSLKKGKNDQSEVLKSLQSLSSKLLFYLEELRDLKMSFSLRNTNIVSYTSEIFGSRKEDPLFNIIQVQSQIIEELLNNYQSVESSIGSLCQHLESLVEIIHKRQENSTLLSSLNLKSLGDTLNSLSLPTKLSNVNNLNNLDKVNLQQFEKAFNELIDENTDTSNLTSNLAKTLSHQLKQ